MSKTTKMSTADVTTGMTVVIDGRQKTVCNRNLSKDPVLGTLIFGRSFRGGVDVVLFKTWRAGKLIGYTACP